MSRRTVAVGLLLAGSEVVGLAAGHWFFGLFDRSVPPAVVTDLVRTTTYGLFLANGALLGLVIFFWALLVAFVARVFAPPAPPAPDAGNLPRP